MKTIQTENFIKLSGNGGTGTGGDYQSQQSPWSENVAPAGAGRTNFFGEKGDSKDDVKKKWKRTRIPKTKVKMPYQQDGVPRSTV
jgi:hypothetical protein